MKQRPDILKLKTVLTIDQRKNENERKEMKKFKNYFNKRLITRKTFERMGRVNGVGVGAQQVKLSSHR